MRVLSAGVAVVRREGGEWRLLLLRAYQYWDFPKGKVEAGETPLEGARREVAEETGITELDFRWGEDYFETGPYARGKVARYYIAETPEKRVTMGINPELGRPEHHEYRWVGFDEAFRLASPRVRRLLRWLRRRIDPEHAGDEGAG
ncbi:NUDIX domain-containing protein [Arhodomonas sp. SL1]|uniref:NUDIX domain-containing protein n=1 Tax=Arhodomonas sp. SL1 TaxID=3425691 RepID=UPI003F8819FC